MLASGGLPALHGAALDHACVHVTNLVFLAGRQRVIGKRAGARCPHTPNTFRVHMNEIVSGPFVQGRVTKPPTGGYHPAA